MPFTTHDSIYHGTCLGWDQGTITRYSSHHLLFAWKLAENCSRYDKEHHHPIFDQFTTLLYTLYPSNVAIKSHSLLPNAREAGVHDLRGMDPIWAGAIISGHSQDRRAMYSGVYEFQTLAKRLRTHFTAEDEQHDPSLEKLIDLGLYDQWGEMLCSTPEEKVMRYSVVCTLLLTDWVEELEEGNESSTKKITEVERSIGALVVQQVKLNDKVTLLGWDFDLNLKYCPQVINFKAQMLGFGLTKPMMDHQEQVQEQLRLQQDWITGLEETL